MGRTIMRTPTLLPLQWILVVLTQGAVVVSAQDAPTLYASQDPRIAEVRQGMENGSQESQRIERAFVGDWIYRHEISQADVGFRWTRLRIQPGGTLVMEYRTNGTDSVQEIAGPFAFIHKGTDQHLPGKRPAVLVTVEPAALDRVLPLVDLTVDYDNRVPGDWGMVLKFSDLEGREFVFTSLNPFRGLLGFDTWAGQTKVCYERPVTNWVPDFAGLGVTNFVSRHEGVWTNSQKFSLFELHPPDAPTALVRLGIQECPDVTAADLALLSELAASAPFPAYALGSVIGLDLGDRCYVPWGAVGERVIMVRNNVCLSLLASNYPVLRLAEKLDCELVARSFRGPVLLEAAASDRVFHATVPTAVGKTYTLEATDSLVETNWTRFPPFAGDGTIRQVAIPALSPQQFFRLRVE